MSIRKIFKLVFIILGAVLINGAYASDMDACSKLNEQNLDKCLKSIITSKTWEPLKSNLERSLKRSQNKINVRFDPTLFKTAITKVDVHNNKYTPVIVLGKNADANELLITLNHELVHYLSTFDRLAYVFKGEKIGECLTEYQLLTLLDEAEAFKSELLFWNNSPAIFKNHFKDIYFNSKLFQKRMNYEEFYKELEVSIKRDKNFVLKKYIDMGEYKQCAKNII